MFTLSWLGPPAEGCETLRTCDRKYLISLKNPELRLVKGDSPNNAEEKNPDIVTKLVGKEPNQGGSNEDTERQDCIPGEKSNVSKVLLAFWVNNISRTTYSSWINTRVFILHESNVNIVDANVLHVDGEVGHDGKGGAVEEEEGALQGQKVHVWPEATTLRGSGLLKEEI